MDKFSSSDSGTFYLIRDYFREMTQPILTINLVFIGNRSMKNLLVMSSTYTTLNDKRVPRNRVRVIVS
jgi:hypothetical protein